MYTPPAAHIPQITAVGCDSPGCVLWDGHADDGIAHDLGHPCHPDMRWECRKPPVGWTCTRLDGHDGPCSPHVGIAAHHWAAAALGAPQ